MTAATDFPLHRLDPSRPPVVLLGGINLVRALGLAGIPAIVASSDPDEPAFASRYCTARVELPALKHADSAVDALMALGDQLAGRCGRRIPLMYGSDEALGLLYSHRERLQRYYRFVVPDPEVGEALISKDRFQSLGALRGLPLPRALRWDGHGPGSVRGTRGPVLVKPRLKVDWHHSTLCHQLFDGDGKARVFEDGARAASHPVVAAYQAQLTFQEYVAGGDEAHWSYHGFADEQGRVLASFVGRKIRTFPAGTGESAFIELAPNETLARLGEEVVRRCSLKGVFKMDFKRDERSGEWFLLEINARYNLWHYLGAVNGVNLLSAAYEWMLGGEVCAGQARCDKRWLSLALDFKAYRQLRARGELGLASWLGSIASPRIVYNVFAWTDPMPWLRFWARRVSRVCNRGAFRFTTVLRQWRSTAS